MKLILYVMKYVIKNEAWLNKECKQPLLCPSYWQINFEEFHIDITFNRLKNATKIIYAAAAAENEYSYSVKDTFLGTTYSHKW